MISPLNENNFVDVDEEELFDFEQIPLSAMNINSNAEEQQLEEEIDYEGIKLKNKTRRKKHRFIRVFILIGLICVYFISDYANVKNIIVRNAKLQTEQEIIKASKITLKSKFLLINNIFKPKLDLTYVENYEIINHYNGVIELVVKEKQAVGYIINEDNIDLVLKDGTTVELKENLDILMSLPRLNVEDTSLLDRLGKSLAKLDSSILSYISDIKLYDTSYEKNMLELRMEDGNRVFSGMNELHLLQNYNNILESLVGENQCIQLDATTNSAYKFECTK